MAAPGDRGIDESFQNDGFGMSTCSLLHCCGAQHSVTGGGSSSQSNDVPTNSPTYPNDLSLTGSSSHVPRPQGSGPMSPTHTQDSTLFSHSKPPERPIVPSTAHEPLAAQHSYTHQTPRGGPSLHEWPGGFLPDYSRALADHQVTGAQIAIDVTGYYHTPRRTPGDASAGNVYHHATQPSPTYVLPTHANTRVQTVSYQQHDIQYSSARRASFPQLQSPTPQQPTNFPFLPTPPRTNSAYSHPGTSPSQLGQHPSLPMSSQWPPPRDRSSSGASNSTPVTYPHSYADSQSPIYPPGVVSSGNPGQAPDPASSAQLPSSLGAHPYQPVHPYLPTNNPPFPVSQPPPSPAPAKGKGVVRNHPYPQSGRQTRRISPSEQPPVASSSRTTLDMSPPESPRASRDKKGEDRTLVSAPTRTLWITNDQATQEKKLDAKRKRVYRGTQKSLSDRIDDLLARLEPDSPSKPSSPMKMTHLKRLARGNRRSGFTRTHIMLTE